MATKKNRRFDFKVINLDCQPTIIVGICPGNQRKNEKTFVAWEGNKSADLLKEAIRGFDNLVLTNVVNLQIENPSINKLVKYSRELRLFLNSFSPSKVICLGNIPFDIVTKLHLNAFVYKLEHPSYIIRFGKDKLEWKNSLRRIIRDI